MVSAESSSDATVRAFFAVELGADARSAAGDVARELRARPGGDTVRWVRPENYHVTLCFLGDIPRSRVRCLTDCAAAAIASAPSGNGPFEMCLGEVQAFPSLERPRVVTLDITPHAPLEALANSIELGSERAGVAQAPRGKRTGGRSFRSHLTLGRVRRGRRAPSLIAPRPTAPVATQVKEVVLFRSELSRTGATYTRMERIPLGKLGSSGSRTEESIHASFTPLED